ADAVEFIIGRAEVSIAFVEEIRIPELLKTLPNTKEYLETTVSFAKVMATQEDKLEIRKYDKELILQSDLKKRPLAKEAVEVCKAGEILLSRDVCCQIG
ncbi:Long chain acyl-CoA synthetase 5-like protein, partial [Drosera capensis]